MRAATSAFGRCGLERRARTPRLSYGSGSGGAPGSPCANRAAIDQS
jgi:hypothetical protein